MSVDLYKKQQSCALMICARPMCILYIDKIFLDK